MFQTILGGALLLAGGIYAAAILIGLYRERALLKEEKGRLGLLGVLEVLIYICASIGISDYLLNTLYFDTLSFKITGTAHPKLFFEK